MSELTYENEEGNTVYTSQFLKNRGSCCKTNCLHCPYGTTLKNCGIQFRQAQLSEMKVANDIINSNSEDESTVSASLLNEAFGNKKKTQVSKFNFKDFYFITIKDIVCGVCKKGRLQMKEVFLKEHFHDQGLDLDTISSHFKE